jgi:hypothetical protein
VKLNPLLNGEIKVGRRTDASQGGRIKKSGSPKAPRQVLMPVEA